jgi:nucleotide-binding universal stress UspA family protein
VLDRTPARCEVAQGAVASVLVGHARARHCDAIVVGLDGAQPTGEVGGVAAQVLRDSPVPVMFLPKRDARSAAAH